MFRDRHPNSVKLVLGFANSVVSRKKVSIVKKVGGDYAVTTGNMTVGQILGENHLNFNSFEDAFTNWLTCLQKCKNDSCNQCEKTPSPSMSNPD